MNKKTMGLVALICSVVAVVCIFLPWLKYEISAFGQTETESYNGFAVAFGSEDAGLKFSFMGLVIVLLLVATLALAVVKFIKKDAPAVLDLVLIVCAVVAGILLFCTKTSMISVLDVESDYKDLAYESFNAIANLGWGAIVGGIASILAGVAGAVAKFVCKD